MQDPDGQPPAPHLTRLMADAWPAAEQVELGEWRLRWTGGFSRRANSAVATGHPGRDLGQAVDAVETFYAERGRPARLQVSGRASPPEHRRRGAARAVMAALGRWGERHGCRSAYLAVLRSNAPAQALHRGAGLTPVDAYAYLCAP